MNDVIMKFLILYVPGIILYFAWLRFMVKHDLFEDKITAYSSCVLIFLGFIPAINLIAFLSLALLYGLGYLNDKYTGKELLRKALFIKEKKEWH